MTRIYRHCRNCKKMFHIKKIHITDLAVENILENYNIQRRCKKCIKLKGRRVE